MDALSVVKDYVKAACAGDGQSLRASLADDFQFKGPMMEAHSADQFLQAMAAMPTNFTIRNSDFVADSDRVAHLHEVVIDGNETAPIPMCEVLSVHEGKITSSKLFFDTKLFPNPAA
ncbi:hypothetical protein PB2503_03442 [Parvularcula bermudensis HTCC2503]|uniref:SnoaL-like domain-containing protein n=1 Tax=Parvularcula bermudensis (strain ATCC BAA-594 / HTCC2503 / KCTC 12087) TaxID=314260 RepID=E0TDK9_PARBH|nr:nuclear transport factor 2 family protein [Parvularcula bermudensis]ADM08764.1 hypothetical protein PB2503_03442 [Parvularcula bermudensis HTCC2503]